MPDRYWVGGSGTWDSSSTSNWSTSSGGASGASAPTSADNAYFDGSSDSGAAFTVTIGTGAVCADVIIGDGSTVTALDQTMTLAGSVNWNIHGSMFLPASNLTRTFTGVIFLAASSGSHTITTNGVNPSGSTDVQGALRITGGGSYTLGSALTVGSSAGGVRWQNGSLDTNNYNVTTGVTRFESGGAKTLTLGSSTWTQNWVVWQVVDSANTTINAGTSTIVCGVRFIGGGKTYYNLEQLYITGLTFTVEDVNTFNKITTNDRVNDFQCALFFANNQTVTTLDVQPTQSNLARRTTIASSIVGTPITLTIGTLNAATADFRDITAAGLADWNGSAKSWGDCGGNTGITFPTAKTVYRIGTGNFSNGEWATSSGGSPSAANYPLAQDTMVFDANTTTGTHTIDTGRNLGTLNMSATTAVTLATGGTGTGDQRIPNFYSDVTLSNNVTLTAAYSFQFNPRTSVTQNITSAGKTFDMPITKNGEGTTVLVDDLAMGSARLFTLGLGTLNLNGQKLTTGTYASSNTNTRVLAFGNNGELAVVGSGGTAYTASTSTNKTVTGSGVISMSSGSAKTFVGGGVNYGDVALNQGGAGTLTITGANTFADITNTNATASQLTFPASTTTKVKRLTLSGSSGNLVSLRSSTSATAFTIESV
jgi:hypothetical protein